MSKQSVWTFVSVVAWSLLVACAPAEEAPAPEPAAPAAAFDEATAGEIQGRVSFTNGEHDTEIRMDADPVCAGLHPEPVYTQKVVSDGAGNLGNVFVYVKQGLEGYRFPALQDPVVLDQRGCQYHPHVFGVMVNQPVLIRNSDPTLHNIHATPAKNREFNQGQPFEGMEMTKTFGQVEIMVPFKCDVHPWMSAYMGVVDHPYFAVSGEDGTFTLSKLPPGNYVLEAWHEVFGTQTQEVTVGPNETVEVNFHFQAG